jgi:hypothetical protein
MKFFLHKKTIYCLWRNPFSGDEINSTSKIKDGWYLSSHPFSAMAMTGLELSHLGRAQIGGSKFLVECSSFY